MRDELLAAILANPDDDAPRTVYADLLSREDDPRGELIALELANDPDPARRRALRDELSWCGIPARRVCTRRGFVDKIAIFPDELDAALALARGEPIRSIELCGDFSRDVFARLPEIRELAVSLYDPVLLEAPCARTIEALQIRASDVELDFHDALPRCRRLSIAQTSIDGGELETWSHLGELEELDVSLPIDGWFGDLPRLAGARSLRVLRANCGEYLRLPALPSLELLEVRKLPDEVAYQTAARIEYDDLLEGTIDLVGEVLTLRHDARAWRDTDAARIACHLVRSDSLGSSSHGAFNDPSTINFVLDALSCGAPRTIVRDGFTLSAAQLPRDNRIDVVARLGATIELELEHYVD